MPQKKLIAICAVSTLVVPLLLTGEEKVDLAVVSRIRSEAFTDSKVMDTMFYLTDVYGPRLTNSPNFRAAGDWAVKRLTDYGLVNVKEEKWGPFGRGWQCKYFEAHMVEPRFSSLMGIPLAWTEGTNGSITGEPIVATIRTEADLDKWKGKLRGKIVMTSEPHEFALPTEAEGRRYSESELTAEAQAPDPGRSGPLNSTRRSSWSTKFRLRSNSTSRMRCQAIIRSPLTSSAKSPALARIKTNW